MEDKIVWDRTNIGENYPGVILPMTFSFIKNAYAEVYKNFLLILGVDQKIIEKNQPVFREMLGYINGHVYYNLGNWHLFLQCLPFYEYNRGFFEAMLDPVTKNRKYPIKNKIGFMENIRVTYNFILSLIFFPALNTKFENSFLKIYSRYKSFKMEKSSSLDLVSFFEDLQNNFFSIWAITIINDFKVMIFFGLYKKLAERNKGETKQLLKNLYDVKNQPRSLLPLKEIIGLVRLIKENNSYSRLFRFSSEKIWQDLKTNHRYQQLKSSLDYYLDEYGERSFNELKLEEPKFKENPLVFLDLIKQYLNADFSLDLTNKKTLQTPDGLGFAERILLPRLKPVVTCGIYKREYYRLKRGKAFNIARETLLVLGKRMVKQNQLDNENDIFYLTLEEVFGYFRCQQLTMNYLDTVRERKKMIKIYEKSSPPRQIITNTLPNKKKVSFNRNLQGFATSSGQAEGSVVVMKKLDLKKDCRGKILVTVATDPGWTVIFPLLKGVITEHGGTLSHASIVTRELGIPCIVKVDNATSILKNNQIIQMDGSSGKIRIIS